MALSDLVIYLRFFTLEPTRTTPIYYKYAQIAIMTGLTQSKVQQLCLGALPGNQKRYGLKKRSKKYNLTAEQIAWLISDETLTAHAGLSCAQRCRLFHRQFPEQHIPPQYLGLLYKQHGVQLKYVQIVKEPKPKNIEENKEMLALARQLLKEALQRNMKVLFADETCFTGKTLPRQTFASKGNNV